MLTILYQCEIVPYIYCLFLTVIVTLIYTGRSSRRGPRTGSKVGPEKTEVPKEFDVNENVTDYFTGSASVDQHFKAQTENRDRYAAGMVVLQKNGVEIVQSKCFYFHKTNILGGYT